MNPLTDARAAVAEALDGLPANIYPGPPRTMTSPAVLIGPGDPWLDASDGTIALKVAAAVRTTDPGQAIGNLEDLAIAVRGALESAGYSPGDITTSDNGEYLIAETTITHRSC
jgi:hypothetical protein